MVKFNFHTNKIYMINSKRIGNNDFEIKFYSIRIKVYQIIEIRSIININTNLIYNNNNKKLFVYNITSFGNFHIYNQIEDICAN